MKLIIDRIEENIAVAELENSEKVNVPLYLLQDAKEGDALIITVEKKSTQQKADTHSIFEKLRNKSKTDA
ncbi:MAG: DUF3006 domain-containing protein [Ruminococcus sp.]|nr:DUF3006 domain-containing protein [Ruminococcus sp.]